LIFSPNIFHNLVKKVKFFFQNLLVLKTSNLFKLNADSEFVVKNGLFCYSAANFIDLLDMQLCKNMYLHKIVDPANDRGGI